jgi:hypothetical protein
MIKETKMKKLLAAGILTLVLIAQGTALRAEDAPDPYAPKTGVPDGYMIIEGDIIVPVDFYDRPESGPGIESCFAGENAGDFWPHGQLWFEFDSNVTEENRQKMRDAMAELEAVADILFMEADSLEYSDHLHVQNSTENSSMVGVEGGEQIVNIVSWGSRFIMCHELIHALGFWHEQSRPDRNTYVTIHWDRIPSDKEHNFEREASAWRYGPYDFDSVMHYGQCSFSTCSTDTCHLDNSCCGDDLANCRTIEVKPGYEYWQDKIGQRSHFSKYDILGLQMVYSENNWIHVNGSFGLYEWANGAFFAPFEFFPDGAAAVPEGGAVIVQPGTYIAAGEYFDDPNPDIPPLFHSGIYSKPMRVKAPLGGVILTRNWDQPF